MSYNIDKFKVHKLEDLKIPLDSFFRHKRKDWHPEQIIREKSLLTLDWGNSVFIKGVLIGQSLAVSEISWEGELSGTAMRWILDPALGESAGELIAVCIWEGGDVIDTLVVSNGVVLWEPVLLGGLTHQERY
jgi:hypothetical protein